MLCCPLRAQHSIVSFEFNYAEVLTCTIICDRNGQHSAAVGGFQTDFAFGEFPGGDTVIGKLNPVVDRISQGLRLLERTLN